MECVFGHALEPGKPDLGHASKASDAIDVDRAASAFILRVVDAEVALAEIDEAVVVSPAI